jgi:hypothetical protein
MIPLIKTCWDKLLLAFATVVVMLSAVWMWQQRPALRRLHTQSVSVPLMGTAYQPEEWRMREFTPEDWAEPSASAQGGGWCYEVFTPPVIHYDSQTHSFTLAKPLGSAGSGSPFGLELCAVKRAPYRLQLVGYFGSPGNYLVAFVSPERPGTMLVRVGAEVEDLELRLKAFAVRKVLLPSTGPWPVYDMVACATLEDERLGGEVELNNRTNKLTNTGVAICQLISGDGGTRELRTGDTFIAVGSTYRIERIQFDPAEVEVVKETPGLPPLVGILHPRGKDLAQVADAESKAGSFPTGPSNGIATNSD